MNADSAMNTVAVMADEDVDTCPDCGAEKSVAYLTCRECYLARVADLAYEQGYRDGLALRAGEATPERLRHVLERSKSEGSA